MCKSQNEIKKTIIEDAFKNKRSNEFYRYYYWNQSDLITCWEQLLHCYYKDLSEHGSSKWLFRGDVFAYQNGSERSIKNAFKTSLDKAFEEFDTPANRPVDESDLHQTLRNRIEKRILRSFRRRAHLLTVDKDGTQTHLETFALLRHFGGPARILDWTYSFFPAVYLALSKYDECNTYTVWALNKNWMSKVSKSIEKDFFEDRDYLLYHFKCIKNNEKQLDQEEKKRREKYMSAIGCELEYYKKYNNNRLQSLVVTYLMNKNSKYCLYAANPYRFNERLAAQRGTLLFCGSVEKTWGENLEEIINNPPTINEEGIRVEGPILWEIPLKLSKAARNEFLRRLDEMNINQASLFPDLGGFAESLRTRIAHPESLGIDV